MPEDLSEKDTIVVRLLHAAYEPVLRFAVANRILTLGAGVLLIVLSVLAGRSLQLEFLPKLEEGNLWIRATMPISISLEEGNGYVNRMRALMLTFPEVVTVVSQHGRPDDGTDTAGFYTPLIENSGEFPCVLWLRGFGLANDFEAASLAKRIGQD